MNGDEKEKKKINIKTIDQEGYRFILLADKNCSNSSDILFVNLI